MSLEETGDSSRPAWFSSEVRPRDYETVVHRFGFQCENIILTANVDGTILFQSCPLDKLEVK